MLAAVKMIVAAGIAVGTLIASIMEAAHPLLVACFWVAFAVGALAAEAVRARRQRSIRSLPRRAGARERSAPSGDAPASMKAAHGAWSGQKQVPAT
jgi:hypothetical protein